MGRWDNRGARDFDKHKPDKNALDEWNKKNNNDMDWRETPNAQHPKDCNCPKHEYVKDLVRSKKQVKDHSPIKIRLCPPHYKAWWETKDEMYKELNWWQKIMLWFALKIGAIEIVELKHMQSELCYWCKFGSGGRGIKVDPLSPDQP